MCTLGTAVCMHPNIHVLSHLSHLQCIAKIIPHTMLEYYIIWCFFVQGPGLLSVFSEHRHSKVNIYPEKLLESFSISITQHAQILVDVSSVHTHSTQFNIS